MCILELCYIGSPLYSLNKPLMDMAVFEDKHRMSCLHHTSVLLTKKYHLLNRASGNRDSEANCLWSWRLVAVSTAFHIADSLLDQRWWPFRLCELVFRRLWCAVDTAHYVMLRLQSRRPPWTVAFWFLFAMTTSLKWSCFCFEKTFLLHQSISIHAADSIAELVWWKMSAFCRWKVLSWKLQ